MYAKGQGVAQDYAEAVKWFRRAAEQGNVFAQSHFGWIYAEGEGVTQDYAEAVKWFRLAAEQGHAPAQYSLGLRYAKGQGVAQDHVLAHMWFNLASVKGEADAVHNRDFVASNMTSQQIGQAQKLARDCQARNFKGCD